MKFKNLEDKILPVKYLFTDCDGVLTDNGVYYSANGEELKRFSIRDGMAVERLKELCQVTTGIITGEMSPSVKKRAEKLKITELYLGAKNKVEVFYEILLKNKIQYHEVAYIGDDCNDEELLKLVGFAACPSDGLIYAKRHADYVCTLPGGHGCFRELAELIIEYKLKTLST